MEKKKNKMPKRKSTEAPVPPVYTMREEVDSAALVVLYYLRMDDPYEEMVVKLWQEWRYHESQRTAVKYFEGVDPTLKPTGPSVVPLKSWMRRALTWRNYHDLNFQHSRVLLTQCLLVEEGLEKYTKEMAALRDTLHRPDWHLPIDADPKKARIAVTTALMGVQQETYPVLEPMRKNLRKAYRHVVENHSTEFSTFVQECEDHKSQSSAKFVLRLTAAMERKCLDAFVVYLRTSGYKIGSLKGHGLTVQRRNPVEEGVSMSKKRADAELDRFNDCAKASDYILEKTGYFMWVQEKSLVPSDDEFRRILCGSRIMSKLPPKQRIYHVLENAGHERRLRRSGLHVMRPHSTIPNVYVEHMAAEPWMCMILNNNPQFKPYVMAELLAWFLTNDGYYFPRVQPGTRYIAFHECCFDLEDLCTVPHALVKEAPAMFFDEKFEGLETKATPLWNKVLDAQFTAGQKRMLQVMLGRLQYKLRIHDNWQVYMNVFGLAGTGKSLIANVARKSFAPHTVGTIGGSQEKTFGYQALYLMRANIVFDCPDNFHKSVIMQDFLKIICGEPNSVPLKNGMAWCGNWDPGTLIFGNQLPAYKDEKFALARRTFGLQTTKQLPEEDKDTSLERGIEKQELAAIFIQGVKLYRETAKAWGSADFWVIAGPEFKYMRQDTLQRCSSIDRFMTEGDHLIRCSKVDGVYFSYTAFKQHYQQYLNRNSRGEVLSIDNCKLEARGFVIKEINMCSKCGQRAVIGSCLCKREPRAPDRKKLVMIRNMLLESYRETEGLWRQVAFDGRACGLPEELITSKEIDDFMARAEVSAKQELEDEIIQHQSQIHDN